MIQGNEKYAFGHCNVTINNISRQIIQNKSKAGFPLGGLKRGGYCSLRQKSNSLRLWRAFLKRQPIEMPQNEISAF